MAAESSVTENAATVRFRDYLRVKTVQPNPDYAGAVDFLTKLAKDIDLPYFVHECVPGKPIVIMTWEGTDPSLPSVLLNSHIDVVPVFPEHWQYDPFDAIKDDKGNIYARGSQDMKCVGMQYTEVVRKLKMDGKRLVRTLHLCFVPDEEIGGHDGMELFVETNVFKKLNVGFALDEGLANPTEAFTVYYGERQPWWIEVVCTGDPGHGSRFLENNSGVKLQRMINLFMGYRDDQMEKLKKDVNLKLGDVTTVNMTMLEGGVQMNVVPSELIVRFDVRITPTQNLTEFEAMINGWCKSAGEGVSINFLQKNTDQTMTSIKKDNPWWTTFSTACDELKLSLEPEIFPAATDSRYLRKAGYPALGFSPMNKTPILLHDHNEYLNEDIYLRGIDIYLHILPAIANMPPQ